MRLRISYECAVLAGPRTKGTRKSGACQKAETSTCRKVDATPLGGHLAYFEGSFSAAARRVSTTASAGRYIVSVRTRAMYGSVSAFVSAAGRVVTNTIDHGTR